MPQVNPHILEWARETAGLSPDEATQKLPIRPTRSATALQRLAALEGGETEPTRAMLVRMSKVYRRPLLTFYLARPPAKGARGQDFRTLPGDVSRADNARVDTLVREARARQSMILEALLLADEARVLPYIGRIRTEAGQPSALRLLQETLGIGRAQLRAAPTKEAAFTTLRRQAERAGMFVILQGDLGSHQTDIPTEVFRGFALADERAPFVVINDNDSAAAWSFTLLHEIVHLFLGATGISGARSETQLERFCDDVASDFLLTTEELRDLQIDRQTDLEVAQRRITGFAEPRKLSSTMVAYRLSRAGMISEDQWWSLHSRYRQLWLTARARTRERAREATEGPSYYVVRRHRLGEGMLDFSRRMIRSGVLTFSEAGRVLAVQPSNVARLLGWSAIDPGRAA